MCSACCKTEYKDKNLKFNLKWYKINLKTKNKTEEG